MEQKLIEVYEVVCQTNDTLISKGEKVKAHCMIFTADDDHKAYDFSLTPKNKDAIVMNLKSQILQAGAKGYILIFDTFSNKKDKDVSRSGECIVRTLYTPNSRIREYVWYKGKTILEKDRVEGRDIMYDEWDAWNSGNVKLEKKINTVEDLFKKFGVKGKNNGGK